MLATSRLWTIFPAFVWTCWRHWRRPHAETCWRLTWRRKWQRRGGHSGHAHGYCELGPHLSLCHGVPDSRVHNCSALKETCQCLCVLMCVRVYFVCAHTNDLIHFLEIMTFTNSFPACRMGENSKCTTFAVLWAFLWCYLCVFQDHVSESEGQVTSKVMIAHTIP